MADSAPLHVAAKALGLGLFLFIGLAPQWIVSAAPEPEDTLFSHFVDQRTVPQGAFVHTELTSHDLGRSFALLVGVDTYPGLAVEHRRLTAAARDLFELAHYLRHHEFFDEVVVLQNDDVTEDNLKYFLQVYYPERLQQHPRSRFLFTYSGHGFRQGERCYLLQSGAESLTDKAHAVSADVLMARYRDVIGPAFRSLALINGCHLEGGSSREGTAARWTREDPGHHIITAEGSMDAAWQSDLVGPGSRFYETLLDGIFGIEDHPSTADTNGDGLVDINELKTFLRRSVRFEGQPDFEPRSAALSRSGDRGGFFFFEGRRQIVTGTLQEDFRGRPVVQRFGQPLPAERTLELEAFYRDEAIQEAAGCRQGNARDCRRLGVSYQYGYGVDIDFERAAGLYRQACEEGHAKGCSYLGSMFYEGKGVKKDLEKDIHYSRLGCDGGALHGCNHLAFAYLKGNGTPKNLKRAAELTTASCDAGSSWGCTLLGLLYRDGQGVDKDLPRAATLFSKACDGGYVIACRGLAFMYMRGHGITEDLRRSAGLFHAACKTDAESCNELGNLYWNGRGVEQDRAQALEFFVRACNDGDLTGCNNVGIAYETGGSVPKSLTKALQIFRQNCEAGSKPSCNHLERLTAKNKQR